MDYARYFCGKHDGTVISEEEYRTTGQNEELTRDTVDYAPIFDGHIYPTLSDSVAAQIAAFGCQYNDVQGRVPGSIESRESFRDIPTETLRKMSDEAFSAYYKEATKTVDYAPGMKFPELERATNRLNVIDEELARRTILEQLKSAAGLEYKGIVFDDFAIDASGDGRGVWAEMCQCCAEKYKNLLVDELDDAGAMGACSVDGCGVVGADSEYEHHYYVDFKIELIQPLSMEQLLEKRGVEILVYESNAQERFGDLFDVASPQECANMFGKPVKDGDKLYLPQDTPPSDRRPTLDDRIDAAKAKSEGRKANVDRDRTDGGLSRGNLQQL